LNSIIKGTESRWAVSGIFANAIFPVSGNKWFISLDWMAELLGKELFWSVLLIVIP
jgi:hypothetical protein